MKESLLHLMVKHEGDYYIASKNQFFKLKGFDKDIINFLAQFIYNNRELEELFYLTYFMGFPVIHKPTKELIFLQFCKNFNDDEETDTLISHGTSFNVKNNENIAGFHKSYFRIEEEFYEEGNLFLLSFLVDIYNILYDNSEFEIIKVHINEEDIKLFLSNSVYLRKLGTKEIKNEIIKENFK